MVRIAAHAPQPGSVPYPRFAMRPVRSSGAVVGAGLAVGALLCVAMLVHAGLTTSSTSTRSLVFALIVAIVSVGVVAVLGALQCATLTYVLGPAAVEIRGAVDRVRLRYEQIEGIHDASPEVVREPGTLWPGAYLGPAPAGAGRAIWRATCRDSRRMIVIRGPDESYVVTPANVGRFKEELIQRARASASAPRLALVPQRQWFDALAGLDPWFRAGCAAALFLLGVDVALGVARGGVAPAHSFAAIVCLAINVGLGCTMLSGSPGAARLLLGAGIAANTIAMVW